VLVLCFLTAVALGLYALVFLRALLVNDKGANLVTTAVKGAHTLDRVLFERYEDIKVFASDRTLLEGERESKVARLRQYQEVYGYYSWIATMDAAGRITAATDPVDQLPENRSRTMESFETVKGTRRVHVEVVRESAGTGPAVVFSAPLDDSRGEFRGIVTSRMPLDHFRAILEEKERIRKKGTRSTGCCWTGRASSCSKSIAHLLLIPRFTLYPLCARLKVLSEAASSKKSTKAMAHPS